MTSNAPILQPVVLLAAWSMLIWVWMLVTRVSSMQAQQIKLDPKVPPKDLTLSLPAKVRWIADNYNHLMEQPTVFYAAALVLALAAPVDRVGLISAWAYVGLRILHSLIQTTVNHIPTRFLLFILSSLALVVLVYRTFCAVF